MTGASNDLEGRVVVITGASRGIGKALAQSFADAGAGLGLLARDDLAVKQLAANLATPCVPVTCDVANPHRLATAFARVADELGGVDAVVANAGMAPASHRAHNLSVEDWRQTLDVNLTGTFLTAQAAYPYLAATGHGRMLLTSSVMARTPRRGVSSYAASKAGIEGLTRALAADWACDGIAVNAIAPGFFDTGLGTAFKEADKLREQVIARTAFERFGHGGELAEVAHFFVSDACNFLTGQVIAIDGGYGLG